MIFSSLLLLLILNFVQFSSTCQTVGNIWTYYPCSFIIAPSTSSSSCSQLSMHLFVDNCLDREIILFWHFPMGNMTLTLQSDTNVSFTLRFFKKTSFNENIIRNLFYLHENETIKTSLFDQPDNEVITIVSDEQYQCSLLFQTLNEFIIDYGTFIRMTVISHSNNSFYEQ